MLTRGPEGVTTAYAIDTGGVAGAGRLGPLFWRADFKKTGSWARFLENRVRFLEIRNPDEGGRTLNAAERPVCSRAGPRVSLRLTQSISGVGDRGGAAWTIFLDG